MGVRARLPRGADLSLCPDLFRVLFSRILPAFRPALAPGLAGACLPSVSAFRHQNVRRAHFARGFPFRAPSVCVPSPLLREAVDAHRLGFALQGLITVIDVVTRQAEVVGEFL